MHFGQTLKQHIYEPWAAHYIDYHKLKELLNEADDDSDREGASAPKRTRRANARAATWTDDDEQAFSDELLNGQLDKVASFKSAKSLELGERTTACEKRLEEYVREVEKREGLSERERETKKEVLHEVRMELEKIVADVKELATFTRVNFTGFMKAAKKHDRKTKLLQEEAERGKGKGKAKVGSRAIKTLLEVRLSDLGFGSEDPSPLLYRLSTLYNFIRERTDTSKSDPSKPQSGVKFDDAASSSKATPAPKRKTYKSYKFWVHPNNIIEVKTNILRRLPLLVINRERHNDLSRNAPADPIVNSIYFDNPDFQLYTKKVEKKAGARSLRLRWYGKLSDSKEILIEKKIVGEEGEHDGVLEDDLDSKLDDYKTSTEDRLTLKTKHIDSFLRGEYKLTKTNTGTDDGESSKQESTIDEFQAFINQYGLEPMMRAVYRRTAFQIPGDDSIKASLDTNIRFVREDSLETERPCRDPDEWHRADLDSSESLSNVILRKGEVVEFPYAVLDIQVRENIHRTRGDKEWLNEIVNSHLVYDVPRFSKFVHGVSVLFDDYVNTFPLWLPQVDKDIQKDPKQAWEAEQARKAKQHDDLVAVGSFTGRRISFAGKRPDAKLTEPSKFVVDAAKVQPLHSRIAEETDEEMFDSDSEDDSNQINTKPKTWSQKITHKLYRTYSAPITLPPGVQKPGLLIKNSSAPKIEPKVWLANQRTFIKWQHISVLLAALGVTLFNAAGPGNKAAQVLAIVYTALAGFTAVWGWWVYNRRALLIRNRDGRDLDYHLGPMVVAVALGVGLIVNSVLSYQKVMEKKRGGGGELVNVTVEGMVVQGGY